MGAIVTHNAREELDNSDQDGDQLVRGLLSAQPGDGKVDYPGVLHCL